MIVRPEALKGLVAAMFSAAGCKSFEAERIGHYLVEANLVGHDSHGCIRVPIYLKWLREGHVMANRELQTVVDAGALALFDGQLGFGQVMGEQVTIDAITRAKQWGVSVVALRNSGHVGRVGDWPLMAASAGLCCLAFVNTTGLGLLTAPFGGIDRRLSANPVAAGIPVAGRCPLLLDISCSAIAEGKIKVALNKGQQVSPHLLIDGQGNPLTDPAKFYSDPGAILPFGGHKGFGLGVVAELLAGAVTTSGCSKPGVDRLEQGMLLICFDPAKFQAAEAFGAETARFLEFVKSSRTVLPGGEILLPGEPEERSKARKLEKGIELDETSWNQILDAARAVGMSEAKIATSMAS